MTDVLRELNFNYANVEKGLNQYLARLNFDQSEEVTNLHASSQVIIKGSHSENQFLFGSKISKFDSLILTFEPFSLSSQNR